MVGMEEYMRKIKFRGWYIGPLVNRMLSPEFHGPINEIFNDPENEGHVVYMQYTGLKDKNGREIYEGDIVKFIDGSGIVKYEAALASFYITYPFADEWWNITIPALFEEKDSQWLEVVGNTFENPELLEVAE